MEAGGSYQLIIDIIVLVAFVFAFLIVENKGKLILAVILVCLFLFPKILPLPSLSWVYYAAKVIFGMACILTFKWHFSR